MMQSSTWILSEQTMYVISNNEGALRNFQTLLTWIDVILIFVTKYND